MLRKEKFGFLAAVVFVLFLTVKMTGSIIPINLYLISSITLGMGIVYSVLNINYNINVKSKLQLLWLLLFYCFISLAWTRSFTYGSNKLFILGSIIFITVLFIKALTYRFSLIIKLFSFASFLILIWYFFENGLDVFKMISVRFRFNMKEGINPITISRFFCFSFIVLYFFTKLVRLNRLQTYLVYSAMLLYLILAFLTGSKGPLLAVLLSFFILWLIGLKLKKKASKKSMLSFSAIVILVIIGIVIINSGGISGGFQDFISNRYLEGTGDGSVGSRVEILNSGFNYLGQESILGLVFGNGLGDYGFLMLNSGFYSGESNALYPHNIFVEVFYETGLIGLVLFLALIIKVITINLKRSRILFDKNMISISLKCSFAIFYFSLIGALFSGDLSGNFMVFVSIILILKFDSYLTKIPSYIKAD